MRMWPDFDSGHISSWTSPSATKPGDIALTTSSKNYPTVNLLPFHPVASKFGNQTNAEFYALVSDIKTNNLRVPIVLHKGTVIDGIQRYRACLNAKVEPVFTEYVGEEKDIVKFIASMNMHRRH